VTQQVFVVEYLAFRRVGMHIAASVFLRGMFHRFMAGKMLIRAAAFIGVGKKAPIRIGAPPLCGDAVSRLSPGLSPARLNRFLRCGFPLGGGHL
jgi:hypothetical protein